ncbi:MAG TPA: carboxypeptidase-like regulatory domain-containing protein, partial [Thermoanaerobaculia bacterium]|nr:carboxypeptidase-like regulatory domain-containing protein [Thermoanaerobaculia bacterium]
MFGRLLVLVSCLSFALPSSGAITGHVMNADGRPLAGARVAAYAPEPAEARRLRWLSETPEQKPLAGTKSDEKGRYSLETPKEHSVVVLLIEAPGFAPHARRAERDEEVGALSLTAADPKSGRITAGGKPLAGARVFWMSGVAEVMATTGEQGSYTVPDPSKWAMRVTVIEKDYALLDEAVRRGPGAGVTHAETSRSLDAGTTLRGRVVGTDGRTPAAGASLLIDGWPAGKTAEDGSFTIERVASKWAFIEARAEGLAGQRARGSDLSIRLQRAVAVRGTVLDAATKTPLAGAEVTLGRAGRFDGRAPRSAISDAKGNFVLAAVTPGSYTLSASRPGYSFAPVAASIAAGDTAARNVSGTKLARVAGSVVDEQKRPVAGARVYPQLAARGPMGFIGSADAIMSAPDGTFVLRINPDTDLQVEARKKGFPAARSTTLRLRPGERKGGVLITIPAGVLVTGRVTDRDGQPLAGVIVVAGEARPAGGPGPMTVMIGATARGRDDDQVRTDAEGAFAMQLREGSYDLAFRREGYATRLLRAHEVAAAAQPVEVVLDPGVEVSGRVTRGGVGVPGVTIRLAGEIAGGETAETAADGSFRIEDLTPGQAMLIARKPDEFIQHNRPIRIPSDDIEIEVPPGGRISGRVFDKDSRQPVTSFEAGLSGSRGGGGMIMTGPGMTRPFTSDDGTFVLENVPPGSTTVVVNASGYVSASIPNIQVEEGKEAGNVEVPLDRGARVSGHVTGPDRTPLSGVTVRLNPATGRTVRLPSMGSMASTDANGEYTFEAVGPGEHVFTFSRSGYVTAEKSVELSGREARVDAQLSTGLRVSGTVVAESGAPVAEAFVSAWSGTATGRGSTRTDQNGNFQLEALAPGRYTLSAQKQGYARAELRDVDVSTGAPVRLVLTGGGTIQGRVFGLSAEEMGRTTVYASSTSGSASAPVDANGNYRIEGAPVGTVRVMGRVTDFATGKSSPPKSVEVTAGATVQQDIEFIAGTVISGRVTRAGRPVAGAMINFIPRDAQAQTTARAQTGSQGHYEVSGLDDATYTVLVADVQRSSSFTTTYELRGSGTFDIDMRTATVRGRVVDSSTGQPVAAAAVELRHRDTAGIRFAMSMVQTDPAGAFTMQEVGAGSYQLSAEKDGYGTKVMDLTVGEAPADVEIKLAPNPGVTLRVVDARDGRLLSASVRVTDMQNRIIYDTPMRFGGSGGESTKIPLEPGSYRAVVMAPGYAAQNIHLTSPGTLTVGMTPGGSIVIQSKRGELRRARLVG